VTGGEADVVDLVVSRFTSSDLRVVLDDGRVLESTDRGETFAELGVQPPGVDVNDAEFDPDDFDHIVLGTKRHGVLLTTDAGSTWAPVDLGAPGDRVDVYEALISRWNSAYVYVLGRNLEEQAAGHPSEGMHIYRSKDGGATFHAVVDQTRRVQLGDGTVFALHPERTGVVYFVDGTGAARTELYKFADPGDRLSVARIRNRDVTAIGFHLYGASSMYLGLARS
jgi:hypothetical protein